MNTRDYFRVQLVATSMLLIALLFASGCGKPRGELFQELPSRLYWPQPPEKARIMYIGQLSGEDDLKREVSSFEALGNLIFGREEVGVFARPYAVVKDEQEKLYVADSTGSVVHILDLRSREYVQFYELDRDRRLMSPIGLIVADERIYVADSILGQICVFSKNGKYLFSFGSDILQRPSGISYSRQQEKIYVSDAKLHAVNIFGLDGDYLGQIEGTAGNQRFNFPTSVWVGNDDKLYVSDTLNYRVQVFDPKGKYLFSIGQHGDRPGCFAHPCGLATDNLGNIYVGDKQFENIQIFNRRGDVLMAFGNEGNGPGEFWLPASIFIDQENKIYVADSFNKRIQVFQLIEGQEP